METNHYRHPQTGLRLAAGRTRSVTPGKQHGRGADGGGTGGPRDGQAGAEENTQEQHKSSAIQEADVKIDSEELSHKARETAEVAVGLGVLALQRAQVQRQALMRQMHSSASEAEALLGSLRVEVDKRANMMEEGLRQTTQQAQKAAAGFLRNLGA